MAYLSPFRYIQFCKKIIVIFATWQFSVRHNLNNVVNIKNVSNKGKLSINILFQSH